MKQCPGLLLFCTDMDRINEHLPPEECWQVAYALRQLLKGMEVNTDHMSPLARFAFSQMSEKVERDRQKYDQICERNRKNAQKSHARQTPASGTQSLPTKKETEKETETEKEKVSEKVSERERAQTGTHPHSAGGFSASGKKDEPFIPPTEEEVAAYASELGKRMDVRKFMDYNISKGWMVGSSPMRDWRAAVRNWLARDDMHPPEKLVNAQRYTQRQYTEEELSFGQEELFAEAIKNQERGFY